MRYTTDNGRVLPDPCANRYGHSSPIILKQKDRRRFIDQHTSLRRIIALRASNMMRMVWSADLEALAFYMAHKCQKEPQVPLRPGDTFTDIGFNSFWKFTAAGKEEEEFGDAIDGAISEWTEGRKYYNETSGRCSWEDPQHACYDYKQMVWANSTHLGCSATYCKHYYSPKNLLNDTISVICIYGNGMASYDDERLPAYLLGEGCKDCAPGFNFCKYGMCRSNGLRCTGGTVVDCVEPDESCHCDYILYSRGVPQRSTLGWKLSVLLPLINCVAILLLRWSTTAIWN